METQCEQKHDDEHLSDSSADSHKDFAVHHLLLSLVDVSTAFAQVEVDLAAVVDSLDLEQSRVLTLVPQATLVASKDGLAPQPKPDQVKPSSSDRGTSNI